MATETIHDDDMLLKDEGGKKMDLPPHTEGPQGAVCIDVFVVKGVEQMNRFKNEMQKRDKIVLRFYCGEDHTLDNGEVVPLWIDKWFTLSMYEKAALRKFLGQWRGKALSDSEAKAGFRVGDVLGRTALIQVSHNQVGDKLYVNIDSVMALPKGMAAPEIPTDYVRIKDRPPRDGEKRSDDPMEKAAHANRKDQRQQNGPPKYDGEPTPTYDPSDDDAA